MTFRKFIVSLTILAILNCQSVLSQTSNMAYVNNNLEPSFQIVQDFNSLLSVKSGIVSYTESSKTTFSEVNIDLKNRTLKFTHENSSGFDEQVISEIELSKEIDLNRLIKADFSVANITQKPLIIITGDRLYSKSSCGIAGAVMDLARNMITQGEATNNVDLVNYGEALLSLAMMLLQTCMQQ